MLHHLLLDWMPGGECGIENAFYADEIPSSHKADGQKATVHRAPGSFPVCIPLNHRDGARTAIAFRATLLRARESVSAEIFQQCRVGRNIRNANGSAIQNKFKRTGHKLDL